MSTTYTPTTARELASALDADPIAASQIKEYISNGRLIELLEIQLPEQEGVDIADLKDSEIVNEVIGRGIESMVLVCVSDAALMTRLFARKVSLETIASFYKTLA